jgi:predicted transcriptional regulator YdeE
MSDGSPIETRIEKCGPMSFIGVALYGNPETTALSNAWELFAAVADDAGISRIGKDIFGLQIYHPKFPKRFELTYMACMERESQMDVPIRMICKSLPEARYAVQKVEGGVTGIDQALIYLYRDYIPKNGLRAAMPIDFEKYCKCRTMSPARTTSRSGCPLKMPNK